MEPTGSWCCCFCQTEPPCASLEEKSGLLAGKTLVPIDIGLVGALLDSPTSEFDMRKASMEEMKVEEETVVTEQVGQGVINTPIKQENGVVQKESMQTEAPPLRHQTGPEGPSNPVATPEKPTPKVAKARSPPPSREVPDTLRDFTSPVDRPAPGAAREKGNSPGFSPDPEVTSPPEVAACGSLNTEGSLPRPLLATPSRAVVPEPGLQESSSPLNHQVCPVDHQVCPVDHQVCPVDPQVCPEDPQVCPVDLQVCPEDPQVCPEDPQVCPVDPQVCPVEHQVCPMDHVCGEVPVLQTLPDLSPAPDSPRPPGDLPSELLVPETTGPGDPSQSEPTDHPDHPMELRDHPMELRDHPMEHRDHPMEHRDHPMELRVSRETLVEDRDPNGPLHSFLGNPDQEQQAVQAEQEVVLKRGRGGKEEEQKEEKAAQVMVDHSVSMEMPDTRVGGEEEELPTATVGDDEDVEEEKQMAEDERGAVLMVNAVEESDEDLYGGDEDSGPSSSLTAEGSCSLAPAVDLLSYSQREWRGNTAKSVLIRKGYQQMMEGFCGVRRVRGDNYCALRATLFQVLSQTTQPPDWLHHVAMLPEELDGPEGLLSLWSFPGERQPGDGKRDPTQRLKGYIELLRKTWTAVADCPSALQRQRQCEDVFRGGEEELGLLEALKLLMLGCALELHHRMQQGLDVPVFCWLLFARDSSPCPRTFLTNHLRHVGVSGGLEQVEMFLLGYALRCTIQVYRLYMSGTEEFLTYYPDDHRDDWPCVSLVTEDDRHYNVPVVKETTTAAAQEAASR